MTCGHSLCYTRGMPSPVRFAVVRKVLEEKGYYLDRVAGSHHVFKKKGQPNQVIPVHKGKVKHGYYKQAQEAQ